MPNVYYADCSLEEHLCECKPFSRNKNKVNLKKQKYLKIKRHLIGLEKSLKELEREV